VVRDRDETETFGFQSETRLTDRDRDLPTLCRDRDETETFKKYVSRPSSDRDVETETTTLQHRQSSPKGTPLKFGWNRGGSRSRETCNISETGQDRTKVTIDDLASRIRALDCCENQ